MAVGSVRRVPDSRFDALLTGWAAPTPPGEDSGDLGGSPDRPGAYPFCAFLTDARRLPPRLSRGHVLAVSVAGFALDVSYVGPNISGRDSTYLERRRGAFIEPLGGELEADAPERPLHLFVSPWQLEKDGLPAPRPGYRIEGTFMFTGNIAGGLPRKRRPAFG